MVQILVFAPLAGFLIAGLFGRLIGHRASEMVTTSLLFLSAALAGVTFWDVAIGGNTLTVPLAVWIDSGAFEVDWALRIDQLTAVMLVVVTWVSALVHLYSMGYMHEDPARARFFAYLSLFTFAMLMLVTADNFLQMFFGWEGVGLASYLLIGFWFDRESANSAAIKAFVVNRVGDFGFALGIFAIFAVFGSLDFDTVFAAAPQLAGQTFAFLNWQPDILTTICLLLFMGAMGKSAQFLLHTWLPDAMEGPTPVSALIHAATMVTAGVFMVCRCAPLFELAPLALDVVTIVGAVTAFFAATVGLFQNDIKRVIAYSTCSQLGYMFFAAGVGAYGGAMFHLFTHAFFKALLFLGAGSVIHAMHHEQDMRRMGGLARLIPTTWGMMLIGTLALTGVGIPFAGIGFAGFHSKDLILESAYAAHTDAGQIAFWLGIAAALMTSFYSWRLMFMTFHGQSRADHHTLEHVHESPPVMMVPLMVLAVGALFAGAAFYPFFAGDAAGAFWGDALVVNKDLKEAIHHLHDHAPWVLVLPVAMSALGFVLAYWFYIVNPALPARLAAMRNPVYLFVYNKWFFDELYDILFVRSAFAFGRLFWTGDRNVIDGIGPDGVAARVMDATRQAVRLQSGYLYHYAFVMLIGIALLVTWFMAASGQFGALP